MTNSINTLRVLKHDGTVHAFDVLRVQVAVNKARAAVEGDVSESAHPAAILADVIRILTDAPSALLPVSAVHDAVERALMAHAPCAAKAYILYRSARDTQRDPASQVRKVVEGIRCRPEGDVRTPWGPVGVVTFKRTYARSMAGASRSLSDSEDFTDTVERVLVGCQRQLRVGFTQEELAHAYEAMMGLKFLPAGRMLWQLEMETVTRLGLSSLQNCAFVKVDRLASFTGIFDMLMLGVDVGFNIQRDTVAALPPVLDADVIVTRAGPERERDADFIVPDSREGWVSLLKRTLQAFFVDGESFTYSTLLIRPEGMPIAGFGGVASGPKDLCIGLSRVEDLLWARRGRRLSTVDCLDLVTITAAIVVAGNVRRSALIAIGDADDSDYLRAKRWDLGHCPGWRAMSNNSVVCSDTGGLPEEFWDGYRGNGEPYGLINLDLARRTGRTAPDGAAYPDPDVEGFNPCAEQGLANYETCCLSEVFLPNLSSFQEATCVVTLAYRICKHSLLLPCHQRDTQAIVHRNMRMGIGITGYMQSTDEQRAWLPALYDHLRAYDRAYSAARGIPPSIKLTTVKPSGTLSLLAGVTPGAHPAIYPHFVRRIRVAASSELAALCRAHGFPCEYQRGFDGQEDRKTLVVSFPCAYPPHATFAKDMTAVDQLEVVRRLQAEWSDNAVSVTVYYRLHKLPDIRAWLQENYTDWVKTCSFLLHHDHGFPQAPYEEITAEQFVELTARTTPITRAAGVRALEPHEVGYGEGECEGGACPVK